MEWKKKGIMQWKKRYSVFENPRILGFIGDTTAVRSAILNSFVEGVGGSGKGWEGEESLWERENWVMGVYFSLKM